MTLSDGKESYETECVTNKSEKEAVICKDLHRRATRNLKPKEAEKMKITKVEFLKEIGGL